VQVVFRLAGLCAIAAGTVLAVDGPTRAELVARELTRHSGVGIIAVAAAVLIYNIAPRGTLAGPLVLAAFGACVLAWQDHRWSARSGWAVAGIAIALLGGFVVIRKDSVIATADPVRRAIALLARRRLPFGPEQIAPERLSLIAVLALFEVDLSSAQRPAYGPVEIFITCWGGMVCLDVPDGWAVVAGRMTAARSIRYSGTLDSPDPFPNPEEASAAERLAELADERSRLLTQSGSGTAVVVHVLGFGGHVRIARSR
jgi:hypothetical protein